ncbi:RsmD family RNA methyltransferase, partial [Magnetococcales bacterium HHB-1]
GGAAFRLIRENIKQCGAEQASWPVRGSATKKETFIKIVQRIRAKQQLWSGFNLVILDPPYRQDDGSSSIHCIEQVDHLLAKDAYLWLETARGEGVAINPGCWDILKARNYGDSDVYLLSWRDWQDNSEETGKNAQEQLRIFAE